MAHGVTKRAGKDIEGEKSTPHSLRRTDDVEGEDKGDLELDGEIYPSPNPRFGNESHSEHNTRQSSLPILIGISLLESENHEQDCYWISPNYGADKRYLQMEARAPTTTLVVVVDERTCGGAGTAGRGAGAAAAGGRGRGTGVATLEKAEEGVLAPSPVAPAPRLPVGVEGAEVQAATLWRRARKSTPSLHTEARGAVAVARADWVRCTARGLRWRRKKGQF